MRGEEPKTKPCPPKHITPPKGSPPGTPLLQRLLPPPLPLHRCGEGKYKRINPPKGSPPGTPLIQRGRPLSEFCGKVKEVGDRGDSGGRGEASSGVG